jgi:hypothetical protein
MQWVADDPDAYVHMPGCFTGAGQVRLAMDDVVLGLQEFIAKVLRRVDGLVDPRVLRLREEWHAITSSTPAEAAFCRAAGRLGLDPYDADSVPPDLALLLESALGAGGESSMVADFLDAATPETAIAGWQWVDERSSTFGLRARPRSDAGPLRSSGHATAATAGYALAHEVRERAQLESSAPLTALALAARSLGIATWSFRPCAPCPDLLPTIRAAVGWHEQDEALVVAAGSGSVNSQRFLEARSLYHAAYGCARGPRLLTTAHTWDQQASRAFAAELLAPRAALSARGSRCRDGIVDGGTVQDLAAQYQVDNLVIAHQLENAGMELATE